MDKQKELNITYEMIAVPKLAGKHSLEYLMVHIENMIEKKFMSWSKEMEIKMSKHWDDGLKKYDLELKAQKNRELARDKATLRHMAEVERALDLMAKGMRRK